MTANAEKPTLLRIGIIIESFPQRRWVRKSLENVLATGLGTFALVVKVEAKRNPESFLYKLYNRMDRRRFPPTAPAPAHVDQLYNRMDRRRFPTTATELVNVEDLFNEVPVVEDVEKVAEFDLDLLINFAS